MDTLSVKSEYKYSCAKYIDNTKMYVIIIKHMITFTDKKNNKSGKSEYKYSCNRCKEACSGDDKNISKEILLNKQVISDVLV